MIQPGDENEAAVSGPSSGGRQAFLDFFETEYPFVVRFAMRMGADLHLAQDAAQEAMTQMWKLWVLEKREIRNPRAYARTVVLNKVREINHRDERARDLLNVEPGWPSTSLVAEPPDVLSDQVREVLAILNRLPGRTRAVFAFYLDDYSTEEIAKILEMRPATVRSTLRNARIQLKRALAQRAEGEEADLHRR